MNKVFTQLFPNLYRDSVALMQLSAKLAKLEGILEASAQMATRANLELMKSAGLLEDLQEPRPNDILLVVRGEPSAVSQAVEVATTLLNKKAASAESESQGEPLRSIQMALSADARQANLALISTPGDYAAAEAMKALRMGMNTMIFSDNVSVEAEVALKRYARSRNLLVMGPDCGTAIIDGIPLAFANAIRKGDIGVIGASGTGIQQVTSLIHQYGGGITHAIGTGGHDLAEAVGGLTMLTALEQFSADPATRVIVLISKPPAAGVADKVLAAARSCGKPVVVCFLGADPASILARGLLPADTLEDAAQLAIALSTDTEVSKSAKQNRVAELRERAVELTLGLKTDQRCLRGLYSGGTFCYEALLLLQDVLPGLQSNTPAGSVKRLADTRKISGNAILDLGDDEFTRGKPHPMIDPSQRNERLLIDAADASVAVILLDFVLGYGANDDPAGEIAPVILAAKERARKTERSLLFIGHICGTDGDPQNLAEQSRILKAAGVELRASNAEAALLCRVIFEHLRNEA
jgi:succinyl-CoA synthetase alpha subunit